MDNLTKEKRSEVMSHIGSKGTSPEFRLRRALWERGLRYRIYFGPEKIDIAFPKQKVAVFVDGCFWHSCPKHGYIPKSNRDYWIPKLERNARLAVEKDNRLISSGWTVLHIWEHELKNKGVPISHICEVIEDAVKSK